MDLTTTHLDTAARALEDAREAVTHDDAFPSDLAAQIAAIRELAWNVDTVLERLAGRYAKLAKHPETLRHDQNGHDLNGDPPKDQR